MKFIKIVLFEFLYVRKHNGGATYKSQNTSGYKTIKARATKDHDVYFVYVIRLLCGQHEINRNMVINNKYF